MNENKTSDKNYEQILNSFYSYKKLVKRSINRLNSEVFAIIFASNKFEEIKQDLLAYQKNLNKNDYEHIIYLIVNFLYNCGCPLDTYEIYNLFGFTREQAKEIYKNSTFDGDLQTNFNLKEAAKAIERKILYIEVADPNEIINNWINREFQYKDVPKSKDHFGIDKTPIKTSKYKFKILKTYDYCAYWDKRKTWFKYKTERFKALSEHMKKHDKILKDISNDDINKFVYYKTINTFRNYIFNVIHINPHINTWNIVAERRTNYIFQLRKYEYSNNGIIGSVIKFNSEINILANGYKNIDDILLNTNSHINQYKGFPYIGIANRIIEENFGYYIVSLINPIDLNFPNNASLIKLDTNNIIQALNSNIKITMSSKS